MLLSHALSVFLRYVPRLRLLRQHLAFFFFFNDTATTDIYPLSLHDALPIYFAISATSPADFNTGATGSSTITVTPSGGFTGTVTLNTVVSPSTGLTANCPPSLTVTSGAVTGTCAPSSSTPGTYLVTITGTDRKSVV